MKRFAALLDRLSYEPSRNNKLRLMADYFATTEDPERGWALAALTGALSFAHAKPGVIRALSSERTDPVLFALSHDYVGDLSETVALMWSTREGAGPEHHELKLSEIIAALSSLGKPELPAALARWLDQLDELDLRLFREPTVARDGLRYPRGLIRFSAPQRSDGRGALSEEALAEFTKFFLKTCLDQVGFMEQPVRPDRLRDRILLWAEEDIRAGTLPAKAGQPIRPTLRRAPARRTTGCSPQSYSA